MYSCTLRRTHGLTSFVSRKGPVATVTSPWVCPVWVVCQYLAILVRSHIRWPGEGDISCALPPLLLNTQIRKSLVNKLHKSTVVLLRCVICTFTTLGPTLQLTFTFSHVAGVSIRSEVNISSQCIAWILLICNLDFSADTHKTGECGVLVLKATEILRDCPIITDSRNKRVTPKGPSLSVMPRAGRQ